MKIAIIGTGGVGGYFGGKLAQAGFEVSFLARGKHLETLQKQGLTVKSISGDFHLPAVKASDDIQQLGKVDLVLLGLKAWQVKDLAKDLKSILHKNSVILPLQNGVLAFEELAQFIPKEQILGGLCRIISKIEAPGVIHHLGVTPTIVFGEMGTATSPRVEQIKTIFDQAGIKSKISTDIQADLWKKFIAICVSGLLAVSNTTYGELRELPETRQMMLDLLDEIHQLSQAIGIQIEANFLEKTVAFIDSFPYESTSSLTRDVWAGKPSEIEYQNGTVVRLGKQYGVPTPINQFVYHCILPMEIKARS